MDDTADADNICSRYAGDWRNCIQNMLESLYGSKKLSIPSEVAIDKHIEWFIKNESTLVAFLSTVMTITMSNSNLKFLLNKYPQLLNDIKWLYDRAQRLSSTTPLPISKDTPFIKREYIPSKPSLN
jgi:hypothetical protein